MVAQDKLYFKQKRKALGQQLGDIEATGRQKAFEQAQAQFERDRAAQLGVQELRAKQMQEANLANQLRFLETQKAQEASRQFGAGLGLKGLEQLRLAGATSADIAKSEAATEMNQLKLQDAIAKQRQIEEQRQLDYLQQQFQARQKTHTRDYNLCQIFLEVQGISEEEKLYIRLLRQLYNKLSELGYQLMDFIKVYKDKVNEFSTIIRAVKRCA